jgi:hypothetical protein
MAAELGLNVKLAKKEEDFYMILVPDAESDLPHLIRNAMG